MKKTSAFAMILMLASGLNVFAGQKGSSMKSKSERVVLETSQGRITLKLLPDEAPKTVANFLHYVRDGFYDGTIFHRVIHGFMIQGGGFTAKMQEKQTGAPIANEAGNGLKNLRGTVAMARTNAVDSATSQFFINLVDNDFLDHHDDSARGFGYCVFAKVVDGMDVVDTIGGLPTTTVQVKIPGAMRSVPFQDVPKQTVVIEKAFVETAGAEADK